MVAVMSILGLTGRALIRSSTCLRLMLHFCWCLLQTSIIYSSRIPGDLINLRKHAASAVDTNDPGWKLFDMIVKLTSFRVMADSECIVRSALELDSDVASFADDMPAEWLFKSIPMKNPSGLVLGTYFHLYPAQWVAYIWNSLRTTRLLLLKEIQSRLANKLATLSQLYSSTDALPFQNSTRILHHMVSEICATVPQCSGYLGMLGGDWIPEEVPRSSRQSFSPGIHTLTNGIPRAAGAYLVLLPLFITGQSTDSDICRDSIVERTRYIGKMTGIQQAFTLADIMDRQDSIPLPK